MKMFNSIESRTVAIRRSRGAFTKTACAFLIITLTLSLAAGISRSAPQNSDASASQPAPSERVANYEDALARAKATGSDIVVFQRGSDWNRLGETLYANLWLKDELLRELGPGFILVAVDHPEVAGGRAVLGQCSAHYCGITGLSDTQIGSSSPLRLAKLADEKTPLPTNEMFGLTSKDGATYKTRTDGTWVAQGTVSPNQDTLTFQLRSKTGGKVIRLDFPPDASLPGGGPGRASNGNFALCEVEAQIGKNPIPFTAAWGSAAEGNWGAWQAIDGISDKGDNLWNPQAHLHVRRTLLLVLSQAVPANVECTVRLICRSQWPQHVPGSLRGAILSSDTTEGDISAVYKAQLDAAKNSKFSWWDTTFCPRIALMDSQNRAVACENKPRLKLTIKTLADRIKELRAVREKRDAMWASAEKLEGPDKAELLRKSMDQLGFANWAGNDNCYKFIQDEMRAADPKDESGAIRWLSFGANGRDGAPGMEAVWKALGEKNYEDALAEVDKQLADPRNKALDHDRIQRIMLAKYQIYHSWPGHEEDCFAAQQKIADLDQTTYLGIGAVGYIGMYRRSPTPFLAYGWGPAQIKSGQNTWNIADTSYYFDHAGPYKVTLANAGGKDSLTIQRIALMDGPEVIAEATPVETAAEVGPGHNVEVNLNVKNYRTDHKYILRVQTQAAEDKTDNLGNFGVEPLFQPPAILYPAAKPIGVASDELVKVLTTGDFAGWQKKLGDQILAQTLKPEQTLGTSSLRLPLAQAELLRACTPEKLTLLAKRDDAIPFLKDFLTDIDWLESFLNSGPADRAAALENLRFLHQYAGADFAIPIYKRLATAMALSVGDTYSRYRFFDRFKHTQWAIQQGLVHSNFERYTVREMRFAIYMPGTARDYQYLLDDRQTTVGDYFGACWAIAYRDPNDYGYSVQGWGYVDPWRWFYGSGLGSRPLIAQRQVGGVCGTLSEYGASASMTHGVMAVTVGQPGHCAYVIRIGDTWGIGNDVFGPASTGFSAWGWDGTGFSVAASLWEKVEADRTTFMDAQRLLWLAHLQTDRSKASTSNTAWMATYQKAIDTQPLNYGNWVEYVKALEAAPKVSPTIWLNIGRKAAEVFAPYHQPSWALANRCFEKAAPTMKPAERLSYLLELHRTLRQENATHLAAYNYPDNFEWQANHLGDPATEMQFFSALLNIHHSKEPQFNGFFGGVLNWGSDRFAGKPATAAAYARAIEGFFTLQSSPSDKAQMTDIISRGIRKASDAGDMATYHLWTSMATRMTPALKPEDVHLNAAQAKAAPKYQPVLGDLLSRDGMLQTSSACQFDRPLSYTQILTGGFGGWFDTNNEEKPWAQVQLAGESVVTGIVLRNRYEYDPAQEEFSWAAPLKVSISPDGKTWTQVVTVDKAEAVFRIDLQGKGLHARYVRIERIPSEDKTKPPGRFHFRNFLVYGHKLLPSHVSGTTAQR